MKNVTLLCLLLLSARPGFASEEFEEKRARETVEESLRSIKKVRIKEERQPIAVAFFIKEKFIPKQTRQTNMPAFFDDDHTYELGRVTLTDDNRAQLTKLSEENQVVNITRKIQKLCKGMDYSPNAKGHKLSAGLVYAVASVYEGEGDLDILKKASFGNVVTRVVKK